MITLMDADSFACACGIPGLDVLEQNKCNLKLLLKYILRQLNSDDVESSDDGGVFLVHRTTRSPNSKFFQKYDTPLSFKSLKFS